MVDQPTPQQIAQAMAEAQKRQNRNFMALSTNKEVLCQQANGGALSQTFSAGQPLIWNVTNANNAYMTGFWVRCTLTCTLAAGASAVYGMNAANPLSLIDTIVVQYGGGGPQHLFRPYNLKYLNQLRGRNKQGAIRSVLAGQQDAYLQGYYSSGPFTANTGANTYNFAFFVPMNIHPQDVRGILPIQFGQTTCQVTVNCAPNPLSVDAILGTFYANGGSGHSVTVTGTIQLIACYKDGQTMAQAGQLAPNLSGIGTTMMLQDVPLNNVSTGQIFRNKVTMIGRFPWCLVTIVDGVQSDKFATTSNLAVLDTSSDQAGYNTFWRYGNNTNLDIREFYSDLSGKMGGWLQQDIDEGIIPIAVAPIYELADPDELHGQHILNTMPNEGWTDFHYGVQLTSTGSNASPGPRLECFLMQIAPPLVM